MLACMMPDMVPVNRVAMVFVRALSVFRMLRALVPGMLALCPAVVRMTTKELFCCTLILVIMLHSALLCYSGTWDELAESCLRSAMCCQ